jgi:hypothetical protein
VDALLLRPLPVSEPERLYAAVRQGVTPEGQVRTAEHFSYPLFRQMRAAVKDNAELIAVSNGGRTDITYGSDQEMEKAYQQYVSGWMFNSLGVRPSIGRVFTEKDDVIPAPIPTLSFLTITGSGDLPRIQRFSAAPSAWATMFWRSWASLRRVHRHGARQICGRVRADHDERTTVTSQHAFWIRVFVRPLANATVEPLAHKMDAVHRAMERERRKGFKDIPKHILAAAERDRVVLQQATAGLSGMQRDYRLSLTALGVLVILVLLIACVNIANLMTARAAARMREMALRVSIGAGRRRLVQLVVVENAWIALLRRRSAQCSPGGQRRLLSRSSIRRTIRLACIFRLIGALPVSQSHSLSLPLSSSASHPHCARRRLNQRAR